MGRTRRIGLRRHRATGTHYVTLADGRFKYFSKDPAVAEKQHADWVRQKYNQTTDGSQGPPAAGSAALATVRDVCNAYLAFLKTHRSPKHFEDMKGPLQEFCDICAPAGTKLIDLRKEQFIAWRERIHQKVRDDKASAFWANKRVRAVKAAFRRAMKDHTLTVGKAQLDEMLFTLYQLPEPMPDSRPFSPADVQKMLGQASDQIQAMILLSLNGCLDNIDVSRIQWNNIDLDHRMIDYPRQKPSWKATRPRRFRLWERTAKALESIQPNPQGRQGRVFSTRLGQDWVRPEKDSIIQELTKLKKKASITQKENFRNFRKSAVTAAMVAGASEVTIEMLLGHASPKMWRRYAGVVPPAVEDAIRKIEEHFFGVPASRPAAQDGEQKKAAGPSADEPAASSDLPMAS
jgi:integrase